MFCVGALDGFPPTFGVTRDCLVSAVRCVVSLRSVSVVFSEAVASLVAVLVTGDGAVDP